MIFLRTLGNSEIVTAGGRLTPSHEMLFASALYLIIERPKLVNRAAFAELLWPEVPESARNHRLRQTLLQLKRYGIPLTATRETVSIAADAITSDLDVLFVHGATDVASIPTFQFLPGYAPSFSRAFADWIDAKRSSVIAAATRCLLTEMRSARARGDWVKVDHLALQCQEADPFNEEAVLARAEGSAMRGAKREAVTILDRYLAELGPDAPEIKLPATLMRKRIAERLPHSAAFGKCHRIFVGREPDMEVLTTLLSAAKNAQGRCCIVWGDPGIGKSRLSSELSLFAELQGVQVRKVACRRGDLHRPLSAFVELVPQLLQMRGALGCSPQAIADLARLTQFEINVGRPRELDTDPQRLYESIRSAIFDLVDALADEQCLMIVVEDVHWLDAASARILGQLADWSASKRLLLLFTSRVSNPDLADACTQAGLLKHQVKELSASAVAALISEMFKRTDERLDDDFVTWCTEMGDGNPFFVHELVRQWFETKRRHVIPPSITSVVHERVTRLSSAALQVLQACAVLGENATLSRIEWMLDQRPHELLGALQELFAGAMLSRERSGPSQTSGKIAARHEFVADCALDILGDHARTYLHRRAGEVLEKEFDDRPQNASLVWACAAHWKNAGERDRAFLLARRCADHLLDVGLPSEAIEALRSVKPFCRTSSDSIEVLDLEIELLESSRRWPEVKDGVIEMRRLRVLDSTHDDYELRCLAATWRTALNYSEPMQALKQCVQCSEASEIHRVKAACLGVKMASDQCEPEFIDDLYATVQPILNCESISDLLRMELNMVYHCTRGDVSEASQMAKRFVLAARSTGDAAIFTTAVRNAACPLRLSGEFETARTLLSEAISVAEQRRSYACARFMTQELVRVYLIENHTAEARKHLNRFDEFEFPEDDSHSFADHADLSTRIYLEEGNLGAAQTSCALLLANPASAAANRRATTLATAIRVIARTRWEHERLRSFVNELESLHLKLRASGFQDYEAQGLFVGLKALGEVLQARKLSRDYMTLYRRDQSPIPLALIEATL
jgi:Predicted ATPase